MDKTVEDQKFLLEATYTEGIREGFAAAFELVQELQNEITLIFGRVIQGKEH